jgi:proline iminopeptidase
MKFSGFLKRLILRGAFFLVISGLVIAIALVIIPRSYNVASWTPLPGSRYLNLPDSSAVAYQLLQPDSLQSPYPLIFLQGGPGGYVSKRTTAVFRPFSEAGFRVCLYDQIGSGSSSRLDDIRSYTVARHVADLDALIRRIGAARVILIGQSWGGMLAGMYAAAHPERIAGIVFTCPGPLPPPNAVSAHIPPPDSLNLKTPAFSNQQANREAANWRSSAASWLALHFGIKLMPDAEADAFQSTLNRLLARSTYRDPSKAPAAAEPGSGYYVQLMTIHSLNAVSDPGAALRQLRVPVLILKGQYDNQSWGVTEEYTQLFRDSRLVVIPGAGHDIPAEQPEAYHQQIGAFLRQFRDSALVGK